MKILHVINVPRYNAVAWYGVQTALAQMQAGHEVYVTADPLSPCLERAAELGLDVSLRLHYSTPNPVSQYLSARRLKAFIQDKGIDVVNAHQGNGYYMIAYAARTAQNRPLLVRTRGDIRYPKSNWFNRKLYTEWSDGIIATSTVTHDRMSAVFPIDRRKIRIILPCVDTDHYKRGDLADDKGEPSDPFPIFGLLGRIDRVKGHRVALEAFQKVVEAGHNVRLVVAGPEENMGYEELKTFARERHLAQRIFFLGPVSDVRDLMRICDAGIIASTGSEAICRVALEFMAMRVPVLGSHLHGIPDIVKDGQNGMLFKTGDPADLAEKMFDFLARRSDWNRLKSSARAYVETHHPLNKMGNQAINFYQTLIASRKTAA